MNRHDQEIPIASKSFQGEIAGHRNAFLDSMDDDFNTGGAIGVLYDLLTALNRFADTNQMESGKSDPAVVADFRQGAIVLKELSQILGIFLEPVDHPSEADNHHLSNLMQIVIDLRAEARKSRNFALADQIRQRLGKIGITLEDRPDGTGWRLDS
jgi:cysteinyl-tRNA synthetase